jgi:hypothetical protein
MAVLVAFSISGVIYYVVNKNLKNKEFKHLYKKIKID